MALVSVMLHSLCVQMLQYLDDWLILASSRSEALQARDIVLDLCHLLGILVNLEKSCLIPSQTATYLGMVLVSPSLRVFPTPKRVVTLLAQVAEFLSCRRQTVVSWRYLLGRWSSLCHLVPGGSSAHEVPTTRVEGSVGLPLRVGSLVVDSGDRV